MAGLRDDVTARDRRSVPALLASTFAGSAASLCMTTALGKQVYDLTGRELDLGLIGLAEFAPAALLVFVTGSVADRFDRRRVAAGGLFLEALSAVGLAWYAGTRPTAVAPIFLLVVCFGVARAFANPASRSLPADVVAPSRLPKLVARFSASWQVASIVGPLLGGFLYTGDVRLPYVAAATLLSVAAGCILTVRRGRHGVEAVTLDRDLIDADARLEAAAEPVTGPADAEPLLPDAAPKRMWRDAVEGLAFVRHHPVLLGAISLDLFAVLFGGAVALLPAIAEERLGVDARGLGALRAAGGAGAALMTVKLAIRPVQRRVGRTLLFAVAAFGVFTLVLGLTTSFVVALVAMAALSAADSISVFIRATLVPLVTPPDKRGRVLAVENVFIGASNELGAFESGVAGHLLGPAGAVVLGGAATLVIAGGWWIRFPDLRDVDSFPGG